MERAQVAEMIQGFEEGSYPKEKWSHEAHFVMALWYIFYNPLEEAVDLIKGGIRNYNLQVGGKNTDEEGYHETVTEFYIRLIIRYKNSFSDGTDFEVMLSQIMQQPFMAKDFPLQYYSKERLMSAAARKCWLPPDINHMP